jgi:two-component system chemotaxis sensor kinase CheA
VKKDITSVIGKGETVTVRGRLLPLIRLNNILGIECKYHEPWNAVLVIVEDSGKEIALQVDSVLDKQEVVIKNLGEKYNDQKCVAGGAILGDGRVGLILDIRSITSSN